MTPPTDIGPYPLLRKELTRLAKAVEFGRHYGFDQSLWQEALDAIETLERRALAAEGLLREAWKNQYLVEWEARVAAHFDQVKP